jgi:hypothetical protein
MNPPDGKQVRSISATNVDYILLKKRALDVHYISFEQCQMAWHKRVGLKRSVEAGDVIIGIAARCWDKTDPRPLILHE